MTTDKAQSRFHGQSNKVYQTLKRGSPDVNNMIISTQRSPITQHLKVNLVDGSQLKNQSHVPSRADIAKLVPSIPTEKLAAFTPFSEHGGATTQMGEAPNIMPPRLNGENINSRNV